MQRLHYIDSIKGLAIFLVVMGHVLAWLYSDYNVALQADKPMFLWKVIYAFHMPLFIFVSGFLFGFSKFESLGSYVIKMYKKTKMLLIPYLVCGILVYLWRGVRPLTYWYLLTLLQLLIMAGFIAFLVGKIHNRKVMVVTEIALLCIGKFAIDHFSSILPPQILQAYDWHIHLKEMYPYFALGFFVSRHMLIERLMNNHVYSLCMIYFVTIMFMPFRYNVLWGVSLQSLAGIYCVFYLFMTTLLKGRCYDYLQRIGQKTLYIYLMHMFVSLKIVQLGDYCLWLVQTGKMGFVSCFVIQLLYSVVVSYILIRLSLYAAKWIETSKVLSFLMLGK